MVPDPLVKATATRLEDHPFFNGLSPESAGALISTAVLENHGDNEVIFTEASAPDNMYLVLSGRIAFFKTLPEHQERVISHAQAGDFFGEIGIFTGAPRALGARTSGPALLARLTRAALREFIRTTPGPVDQIFRSIVNHLDHTTRHYVEDMIHQEKMALVGNMVNSIIHDFKNPFTLISLGAQLLIQKHQDERTRTVCANIIQQVERMTDMAHEISEFSKGTQTLKIGRVDLRNLAERFRELNEPYFNREGVRIEVDVDPIIIEGEENKLLRVIQNLVVNAIDAVEDRPDGLVRIQARDRGDYCEIIVSDNGQGIPEEIRNRLFEPFVTHGKRRGTGLGTAIVKSIIDAHNGRIRFESATGRGTTFFIVLPMTLGTRI
ncbi:MAG: ATP-binding protein [Opitutales bacterium]|jgi:signal transduction histidine kinase